MIFDISTSLAQSEAIFNSSECVNSRQRTSFSPLHSTTLQPSFNRVTALSKAYRSRDLTQSLVHLNALGFDDDAAIALLNEMSGGVR